MGRFFERKELKKELQSYLWVTLGTFLTASSVTVYFGPLEVVPGGVTGIAILVNHLAGVPIWLVNVLCNIPLFVAGYRLLRRKSLIKTLYAATMLSFFLGVVPPLPVLTGDTLVDVVLGGVLMGTGLGTVLLQDASSGGADMLATLLSIKYRHISIPKLVLVVDGAIVLGGALLFGIVNGIYAFISLYVMSRVSDSLLEGPNRAKLMYVITEKYEKLADYIVQDLKRGVTCIPAEGYYTHEMRPLLLCVVSNKEMVNVKQEIYAIDPRAICFVGDIREAFGEGFTKYNR